MLGLLLAMSLAGSDDGVMCVGVPSNPKFTSETVGRITLPQNTGTATGCILFDGNTSCTGGVRSYYDGANVGFYTGGAGLITCATGSGVCTTNSTLVLGATAQLRGINTSGSAIDLSSGIAQLVTGSGAAGILCTNSTATCAATGVLSASSAFLANSAAVYKTTNNGTAVSNACGFNTGDECNFSNAIGATAATASVAAFKFYQTNGTLDATDLLCDFGDNAASKFKVDATGNGTFAGSLATTRELVVDKVSSGIGAGNLLATATNYSGWKFPQAWTLTHMSINVTTASSATVANTVLTTTDGTNTCTFTFACNTDSNTTGVKDKAGVNGAGTGCVYAAGALVTLSVTTQGCATAITTNSITTWGKPQ